MHNYEFLTNFRASELKDIYIAVTAVGITDYLVVKNAVDLLGNPLPGYHALYFKNTVPKKDIELFLKAGRIVDRLKEGEVCE